MPVWVWIVIAIVVIAILVWLALRMVMERRRSARLQERFGPEYQRTVNATGRRKDAEAQLQERQARHQQFDIRPLSPGSRERYQNEWQAVQAQFVDDPALAVTSADRLCQSVMRERGYPVEDFETRAGDLSVEHPDVVQNYREGHRLAGAARERDKGSTEDLRRAMRHYRVLFDELVGPATGERVHEERMHEGGIDRAGPAASPADYDTPGATAAPHSAPEPADYDTPGATAGPHSGPEEPPGGAPRRSHPEEPGGRRLD